MRRGFVIFMCFFAACGSSNSGQGKGRAKNSGREAVKVVVSEAKGKEESLVIQFNGETAASDSFALKTSGRVHVQKVFVEEGQKVRVGDPLISFDQTEYKLRLELARAEIHEMEVALEQDGGGAAPEPKEVKEVIGERPGKPEAQETKEESVQEVSLEDGSLGGEKGKLRTMHEATLERAKAEVKLYENVLQDDQMGSPIAGVVARRRVSDGMTTQTEEPLLEVAKLDPLHFVFSLPVQEVGYLKKEEGLAVTFPALKNLEMHGSILSIGAAASREEGKVEVKLALPNEDTQVRASVTGEVHINTGQMARVFSFPDSALVREGSRHYLFVVDDKKVKKTPIELGAAGKGLINVRSGLKEDDLVVVQSERPLRDNDPVVVAKK